VVKIAFAFAIKTSSAMEIATKRKYRRWPMQEALTVLDPKVSKAVEGSRAGTFNIRHLQWTRKGSI
jgi:hypothetical protein